MILHQKKFENQRLTCVRACRILYSAEAHLLPDTDPVVGVREHQAGGTDVVEALNLPTHSGKILQTTAGNYKKIHFVVKG